MLIVSHDRAFIDKICDCIIEIKNQQIEEFNGDYSKYIENEGNKKLKTFNHKNKDETLSLENEMSYVISMLCVETNPYKKSEYEKKYDLILAKLK